MRMRNIFLICMALGIASVALLFSPLAGQPPVDKLRKGDEVTATGTMPPFRSPSLASNSSVSAPPNVSLLPDAMPIRADAFTIDIPPGWNELRSVDRVRLLEARYTAAVGSLEDGTRPRHEDIAIAESALTSMRAELYGTEAGKAKHRAHEVRLDRALEKSASEDKGVSR